MEWIKNWWSGKSPKKPPGFGKGGQVEAQLLAMTRDKTINTVPIGSNAATKAARASHVTSAKDPNKGFETKRGFVKKTRVRIPYGEEGWNKDNLEREKIARAKKKTRKKKHTAKKSSASAPTSYPSTMMANPPDRRPRELNPQTGEWEKMGGKRRKSRRKRRRKRRRSRRGGKWCKCSDLEKICEKREKRKAREKRSEASALRFDERKLKRKMEEMKRAMSPDALAISDGTMTYVRPPKSPPRTSRKLRRSYSNSALVAGGRRRKTRRRRKRRRTRRKRRRRRTRRKRGGAPKWLDGVDKEYIFKEGGTWFLLRDKKAKKSDRPANTYPHLHGGPNWLNCTFVKGDRDEIWLVDMEGYKKGSLHNLEKNIADKGPKPLHLNAAARVEWKKVVTNMKDLGAGGGGGGSGVRSSSPRHRGGPAPKSFKPVTHGEILGKKARTTTPPNEGTSAEYQLRQQAVHQKAAAAKKKEEDDMALAIKLSKQRISPASVRANVRAELIKRGWNAEAAKWAVARSSTVDGCEKELWKDWRKPDDPFGEANMKKEREEARLADERQRPSKSRFAFAASDPEPAAAAAAAPVAPKTVVKIDKKKTTDLHSLLGEGFFK